MRRLHKLLRQCHAIKQNNVFLTQREQRQLRKCCVQLDGVWGGRWHADCEHTAFQKETQQVRWLQDLTNKVFRPIRTLLANVPTDVDQTVLASTTPTYNTLLVYGHFETQIQPAIDLLVRFFRTAQCKTLLKMKLTRFSSLQFASIVFHLNALKVLVRSKTSAYVALQAAEMFNGVIRSKLSE